MTTYFKYFLILLIMFSFSSLNAADKKIELSKGQRMYVPAYSHIYSGNKERPFPLAVTLSIRNIDPMNLIEITLVDYYETQGKLLKKYIDKPLKLKPLESYGISYQRKMKAGGLGPILLLNGILINPLTGPSLNR